MKFSFDFTRRRWIGAALASAASSLLKPAWAARSKARSTAHATIVKVRKNYARGPYGQLHYRRAEPTGKPSQRPLFCFHSSPNSGRIYETFLREIGTDRVAVAVDTPGFGDSDPPSETPTISDYAAAMKALVRTLGFDAIDVMGYHTGSKIAVQLALSEPDLVKRVLLVSAPVYHAEELAKFRPDFARTELTTDGSHLVSKWREHVKWAMPGWTIDHVAKQFPDAIRRPDISWWGHNAAFNYDMRKHLGELKHPVLVLNPDDDLHEPTQRAAELVGIENVRHLPGWGHGFLDLHPDKAAAITRDFLDATSP